MGVAAFEEAKPESIYDNGYAQVPPGQINALIERHHFEEKGREEGKDNGAPRPPDMVAAAFEEVGLELIDDDGYTSVPDMIAASFEAVYGYKEEKLEEGNDEEAPRPPDMIASSFEGHGYEEEEKQEEGEDDKVPRPPSITWLAMSGFVSVGYTPQTTDICVCC
jgi:hypothetical protein